MQEMYLIDVVRQVAPIDVFHRHDARGYRKILSTLNGLKVTMCSVVSQEQYHVSTRFFQGCSRPSGILGSLVCISRTLINLNIEVFENMSMVLHVFENQEKLVSRACCRLRSGFNSCASSAPASPRLRDVPSLLPS